MMMVILFDSGRSRAAAVGSRAVVRLGVRDLAAWWWLHVGLQLAWESWRAGNRWILSDPTVQENHKLKTLTGVRVIACRRDFDQLAVLVVANNESFCGYPNFEITCKDKDPISRFLRKLTSNNSLLVVNAVVHEHDCPTPQRNVSLDRTPFSLSPDNVNLSFLYNSPVREVEAAAVSVILMNSFAFAHTDLILRPAKMGYSFACIHVFTYEELEEATNNFDSDRELGDGGFGTVYYGKLRDGRAVAVKRFYENNYKRVEQFMNEVDIITWLRHQNLVSLYGSTSRHSRELLLLYEYVSNGTVADHLHGERAKPGALSWHIRLEIAIETENALRYLHASDTIHRDVKTNNILLDNYFRVKVADFGLSRLFPIHVTHVTTAPQGTPGYVDPEYHQCYQLTSKSDVFSFGVVLIELISSKPAVDIMRHRHEINLWNMAINKIQNGALHELVDPSLGFEMNNKVRKTITGVAEVAFGCLQNEKDMRPTMAQVLEALMGIKNEDYKKEKAEEMDTFPAEEEGGSLKSGPLPSPDYVMLQWEFGSYLVINGETGGDTVELDISSAITATPVKKKVSSTSCEDCSTGEVKGFPNQGMTIDPEIHCRDTTTVAEEAFQKKTHQCSHLTKERETC
ncbi:putative serine/threonine-protein kinase [Hibiscus syriacus]|uniref:Serine/threonine-protein kinase n=1 Tax=Hibiscus syriacus TaxID=106335 RepID=A0A6A2WIE3_HIBSY|nr:putative serine/threonine-protein kinase [Hibiscus syriacus]